MYGFTLLTRFDYICSLVVSFLSGDQSDGSVRLVTPPLSGGLWRIESQVCERV